MKFRSKRVLLVLPEVFGATGGIQMFCRSLCLAAGSWAEKNDVELDALVLNDCVPPDSRYVNGGFNQFVTAGKNRTRLAASFLKRVLPTAPDLVVFGHIGLSKLAVLPAVRLRKSCIVAYGIEVWRSLPAMETKALSKADAVIAISDYTARELFTRHSVASERVRIIQPSLDPYWTPDEPAQESGNPPIILTVARLSSDDDYKGVDSVIRSLPAVVDQIGRVEYRIVGSGDDIPRLQALARDANVSQFVTFTGELSAEALRNEYRECSLFVMPSEMEGFGIVFLEAMAYSKAVVGGAHAGTPSVIKDGETGLLVKRLDVNGIANAIVSILKDVELRVRLGRSGHKRLLENFTFRSFEANIDSYLRSVLETQDR
jgi:phosphatidylinositol alpha-1,6-mannosyltransferase